MADEVLDFEDEAALGLGPKRAWVLPTLLFVSGFCGLVYEVVWARYLRPFVGSTATAHTIVLGTFMAGLAGGAWLFGRRADETDRPLALYGHIELGIAAFCSLLPWFVAAAGSVYLTISHLTGAPVTLLRVILAIGVIAVPALLMGGSLPAATRFYVRHLEGVGAGVGHLYFINSLGAVCGALVAGVWLISHLGLDASLWLAAVGNAGVGLMALRLSRLKEPLAPVEEEVPDADEEEMDEILGHLRVTDLPLWVAWVALGATALSGAAGMIYEVTWIRLLTLVLGGSTYAFTIMLVAFVLGIALGSGAVSAGIFGLHRAGLAAFAALELVVALVVLGMFPVYERLPYYYLEMASALPREPGWYPAVVIVGLLTSLAVMIVPTTLLGATFPLAARLSSRTMAHLGGGVGRAYAVNTVGTLLGVVLAGHVLLPSIQVGGTLRLAATINALAGIGCLVGAMRIERLGKGRLALAGVAVLSFLVLLTAGPDMDRRVLTRGTFRVLGVEFDGFDDFREWQRGNAQVLYDVDGATSTVTVFAYKSVQVLNVDGKPDASTNGDMPTQLFVGHLPMLLHPNPEKVFLVGLGGGVTASAILAHEEAHLTTVELSPEIIEGARLFGEANRHVHEHPRHDLYQDDAKAWLQRTEERYDVIVSQPSNPWYAGNAALFTEEFFTQIHSRLAEGGLGVVWFHDYELSDEAVKMILRTFMAVFPEAALFHGGEGRDYVLIGSDAPLKPDLQRMRRILTTNPLVRADLKYLDIGTPVGVMVRHMMDDEAIRDTAGPGELHTDVRPRLDYIAPVGVFVGRSGNLMIRRDLRRHHSTRHRLLWTKVMDPDAPVPDALVEETVAGLMRPFQGVRLDLLEERMRFDRTTENIRRAAHEHFEWGDMGEATELLNDLYKRDELSPEDAWRMWWAVAQVAQGDEVPRALAKLYSAVKEADSLQAWEDLAELAADHGAHKMAADAYDHAVAKTPKEKTWKRCERMAFQAISLRESGQKEKALAVVEAALELHPRYYTARAVRRGLLQAPE